MNYIKAEIGRKPVYIFDNHATALEAWADYLRISNPSQPPLLLTFDSHTDNCMAFRRYASAKTQTSEECFALMDELCSKINYRDPKSVSDAVALLNNDEHIRAAVAAKILSGGFVVCEPNGQVWRQADGIFEIECGCLPTCQRMPCTDDCTRPLADHALEDVLMNEYLHLITERIPYFGYGDVLDAPYILDIDLDYFRTKQAIKPCSHSLFYKLIQNAKAITIAREPRFVAIERLDNDLTADVLEPLLLEHIRAALP